MGFGQEWHGFVDFHGKEYARRNGGTLQRKSSGHASPACTYTHSADNAGWFAITFGIVLCRCFTVDPPPSEKRMKRGTFFGMPAHRQVA